MMILASLGHIDAAGRRWTRLMLLVATALLLLLHRGRGVEVRRGASRLHSTPCPVAAVLLGVVYSCLCLVGAGSG